MTNKYSYTRNMKNKKNKVLKLCKFTKSGIKVAGGKVYPR